MEGGLDGGIDGGEDGGLEGVERFEGEPTISEMTDVNEGIEGTDGTDGVEGVEGVDGLEGLDGREGLEGCDKLEMREEIDSSALEIASETSDSMLETEEKLDTLGTDFTLGMDLTD